VGKDLKHHGSRAAARQVAKQGGGLIITVTSVVDVQPIAVDPGLGKRAPLGSTSTAPSGRLLARRRRPRRCGPTLISTSTCSSTRPPLWARSEFLTEDPRPGDGTITAAQAALWRAILLRRPRWRTEAEIRAEYEEGAWPAAVASLEEARPGEIAIDLAVVDVRPAAATETDLLLAIEGRDGAPAPPLSRVLARLPAYALVGRRFRKAATDA